MAFRLKLVPEVTNIDFFRVQWLTFGLSIFMIVASLGLVAFKGMNLGVDFLGGTTIRAEANVELDIAAYRDTLSTMDLGDVSITEVKDPAFRDNQHVMQIRIGAREGEEAVTSEVLTSVEAALKSVEPSIFFAQVESVGPKVSGELIWKAALAVIAGAAGIMVYVWMRFEWQMALGTVAACLHDVIVTMGIFSLLGIRFDLSIVAALLTILGYSVNDTVVIFDRLRENLAKYKTMPLREMMNLTANETLSRTIMTSTTTLIALLALLIWGGDVIRGFVFAMVLGVLLGTYSTLYMAKNIVLFLGLDRSEKVKKSAAPDEFADIDA